MSMIKLLGKTNIQGKTIFETVPAGYSPTDANAISYIAAVEAADGQTLETPVKQAIENFIVGCKSDGIWTALKASCILAGARTLNGALVPLVGSSPTNNNFVSADYNRKTGLRSNGSTKYLNTNRKDNAEGVSRHASVYLSEKHGTTGIYAFISGYTPPSPASAVRTELQVQSNIIRSTNAQNFNTITLSNKYQVGLIGHGRTNSTSHYLYAGGAQTTGTFSYLGAYDGNVFVYRRPMTTTPIYSPDRFSFYSLGQSIDLAALDTRVSALMTALNTAI